MSYMIEDMVRDAYAWATHMKAMADALGRPLNAGERSLANISFWKSRRRSPFAIDPIKLEKGDAGWYPEGKRTRKRRS